MSWMYKHKGPACHWLLDLFNRMKLPRFDGMAEALKALNISRFQCLSRVNWCDVKRKRRRAKKRHRQSEQAARKLWVRQQKCANTHGKEAPKSSCKRKLEATYGKETPKSSCEGKVEAITTPKKKAKIDVTDDGKHVIP